MYIVDHSEGIEVLSKCLGFEEAERVEAGHRSPLKNPCGFLRGFFIFEKGGRADGIPITNQGCFLKGRGS